MAVRFYIVPKDGTGAETDPYRAKYVSDLGLPYAAMDYGAENTMIAGIDVSGAQHTALAANGDVIAIPQNLDAAVGVNLAATQAALESLNIPADWVNSGHTYREVVRIVGKLFMLLQRFNAVQATRFFASTNLDATIGSLTTQQRNRLLDAATSLGLDTSSITGSTTIRAALRSAVQQLPSFSLFGERF